MFNTLTRALLAALACALFLGATGRLASAATNPTNPAELFSFSNVWTVELKFTADQWAAMQPKQTGGGMFNMPRGGFGPGMFVAPKFTELADSNSDKKVSALEFETLAAKLFAQWAKGEGVTLTSEQLGDGLTAMLTNNPTPPAPMRSMLQGAEGKRNGIASSMGFEFPTSKAQVVFNGTPLKDVSVRFKGNGTFLQSRESNKKSFKLDLDEHVKDQKLAGVSTINLHNNITDGSWMNESLSYKMFRDGGVPASRTAYAKVYVTVPGEHERAYFGLYSLVQNVDGDFEKDQLGLAKGAFFKPVTTRPFEDMGDEWSKYNQAYDPKDSVTAAQKQRLIDFCKFVSSASDADFAAKFGEWVDIENFSRYMAALVWLAELDGILGSGQNYYVYLNPSSQKFQFAPWDMDHSFGQFWMRGSQEDRNQLSIHKPWGGEVRFLDRAFKTPAFKNAYLARLAELNKTLGRPERLAGQVDLLAAALRPAVKEESEEKLERFEKLVAGKIFESEGGFGRGFPSAPSVQPVKAFAKVRASSVAEQLEGKSKGKEIGDFGFGGGGRGPGGPGRRGPGGPGGGPVMMAPGPMLSGGFMTALDSNKDAKLSREEFVGGFSKWHQKWSKGEQAINQEQITEGLNGELNMFRGGPGPGGFPGGGRPSPPTQ